MNVASHRRTRNAASRDILNVVPTLAAKVRSITQLQHEMFGRRTKEALDVQYLRESCGLLPRMNKHDARVSTSASRSCGLTQIRRAGIGKRRRKKEKKKGRLFAPRPFVLADVCITRSNRASLCVCAGCFIPDLPAYSEHVRELTALCFARVPRRG